MIAAEQLYTQRRIARSSFHRYSWNCWIVSHLDLEMRLESLSIASTSHVQQQVLTVKSVCDPVRYNIAYRLRSLYDANKITGFCNLNEPTVCSVTLPRKLEYGAFDYCWCFFG